MEVTAGQGDLAVLFGSEAERIFGFLLLRCGRRSLAEDLTAETFAAAAQRFHAGAGDEITPSWLLTVARRRLIDHWRRTTTSRAGLLKLAHQTRHEEPVDGDPDGVVEAALDSLPERQRAVLVLRYLDGFSTSEVATAMDTSYKATESLLARARAGFRAAYQGGDDA